MRKMVRIEDIEGMRQREGIDDVELREEVRSLQVGDAVRVTLLADAMSPVKETIAVRILRIDGGTFQVALAAAPAVKELSHLRRGSRIAFTPSHIHSLIRASNGAKVIRERKRPEKRAATARLTPPR